jgi:hypothetical protein
LTYVYTYAIIYSLDGESHQNTPGRRLERMTDEMTVPEINAFLETIAKLVEATAKTPKDAAKIIREAKPEYHKK